MTASHPPAPVSRCRLPHSQSRRVALLAAIFLAAVAAAPLSAQLPEVLVVVGDTTARAPAVRSATRVSFPVTVLAPLGAEISTAGDSTTIRMFGFSFGFRTGESSIRLFESVEPLSDPAFEVDGVLHLPAYFFVEWLPRRFAHRIVYDASRTTLSTRAAVWRSAQERTAAPAPVATTFTADPPAPPQAVAQLHLRVNGSYFSNLFQEAPSEAPVDISASVVESRITLRSADRSAGAFVRASGTGFQGFTPATAVAGGFDWTGRYFGMEGVAGHEEHSPRLPIADRGGFADIDYATGNVSAILPEILQVLAIGERYQFTIDGEGAAHEYAGAGGAARFRGFTYRFMPEVGAMRSRFEAPSIDQTFDEQSDWVAARLVPVAPLYLQVRYRRSWRTYVTANSSAANFNREDTRSQWTVLWDLRLSSRVSWNLYYTHERAQSTLATRRFTTQGLTSGLSARVW